MSQSFFHESRLLLFEFYNSFFFKMPRCNAPFFVSPLSFSLRSRQMRAPLKGLYGGCNEVLVFRPFSPNLPAIFPRPSPIDESYLPFQVAGPSREKRTHLVAPDLQEFDGFLFFALLDIPWAELRPFFGGDSFPFDRIFVHLPHRSILFLIADRAPEPFDGGRLARFCFCAPYARFETPFRQPLFFFLRPIG